MRHILLSALFALAAPALPALAQDTIPVQFEHGTSGAMISGTITGHGYADYQLGARAGQKMDVTLTKVDTNGFGIIYFNILPPGSEGEAIYVGSRDGDEASVELPENGDYIIRVYQMGDDRDSGKTTGFTLAVEIH